ncbi:hypothetical protein THAOC_14569 [Thalassiosira oceanica]|uniref:Auto-transporter adhesin head GIN domain-containing protein n=1 Tax=Thalassiosira oceanica TaxID=159749 RepID=K0SH94_THAOC|nr:hypothetical protein THAOC_14569 [Thalassiosira oceanica]|eukprot:EJK64675.1 hypothetical protein THAOC_14569 [Thalassiosira oceanica]
MNTIFRAASFLLFASGVASAAVDFVDFVPITIQGDAGSIQSIEAYVECPGENTQVPNTMFTIEPGSEVGVSANLADLVVAEVADGGVLRFSWNPEVAFGASSSGVKITMPADQLRSVVAGGPRPFGMSEHNHKVQILEGFTSIDALEVFASSNTIVWASFNDVQSDLLVNIDNTPFPGGGHVHLKSAELKSLVVDERIGGGTVNANVDGSVDNLDVKGHVSFSLAAGDIKGGSVSSGEDNSLSLLRTNSTVSGVMTVDGTAQVRLHSCANVSTSGKAKCWDEFVDDKEPWEGYPPRFDHISGVSVQPATHEGTHTCEYTGSGQSLTAYLAVLLAVAMSFMVV